MKKYIEDTIRHFAKKERISISHIEFQGNDVIMWYAKDNEMFKRNVKRHWDYLLNKCFQKGYYLMWDVD